jgi:hypothetical protein
MEAYEPGEIASLTGCSLRLQLAGFQQDFIGVSTVSLHSLLRAKYACIVMDVAWGLFELRLCSDPTTDPDALWAQITSQVCIRTAICLLDAPPPPLTLACVQYLHIVPHCEISWWARRGQLADPLYMVNYGVGASVFRFLSLFCLSHCGLITRSGSGC